MKNEKSNPEELPLSNDLPTKIHDKDTQNYLNNTAISSKIKSLFLTGQKYTAKQLNAVCGFNDARKAISVLRSNGMDIKDVRLENRCKLYWYVNDDSQLSLFGETEVSNG